MTNWISVADEVPIDKDIILIHNSEEYDDRIEYSVGYYDKGEWYGGYNCYHLLGVTHWVKISPPTNKREK